MTFDQLLERLADAISESTKRIEVLTPPADCYAQPGDSCKEYFEIIDLRKFSKEIQRIREELPDEH